MIPRIFARMLAGRAPEESRPRRPPMPQWVVPTPLNHPQLAQGGFFLVEPTAEPARPVVTIEVVDPEAAQLLAEEAKQLATVR